MPMLARQLAICVHIARSFGLRKQSIEFQQPLVGASELVRQTGFHS
jgi:hypothetical protein